MNHFYHILLTGNHVSSTWRCYKWSGASESILAFEDTWIRYIGDRCRYRMAIEDDDIRDRAIWASVARDWVSKASDNGSTTGPSYRHLAMPFALQQLSYEKCLCAPARFSPGRKSIMTSDTPLTLDTDFAGAHSLFLAQGDVHRIGNNAIGSLNILDRQTGGVTWTFINQRCSISTTNNVSEFGSEANPRMKATSPMPEELPMDEPATSTSDLENALEENTTTLAAFCQRY
ncbi:hypothetical protein B0O99DRAFT_324998 [Bisporella sp. PMI_857]|nr:hypothetical protein B0O99DRAFT_368028 [Bisporella sp. PMI_857]KAH8600428.1 hypothetical protein B0O99DRAFT_324998 [Bisporella sp. PMI_857]